jgi:hypothetical protein
MRLLLEYLLLLCLVAVGYVGFQRVAARTHWSLPVRLLVQTSAIVLIFVLLLFEYFDGKSLTDRIREATGNSFCRIFAFEICQAVARAQDEGGKSKRRLPDAPGTESEETLLGQYSDWAAYSYIEKPAGTKACFAVTKPKPPSQESDARCVKVYNVPAENAVNEVQVIGYPFRADSDAIAQIGSATFALHTQDDFAVIKDPATEPAMIAAMRKGFSLTIRGISDRGAQISDQYSLYGFTSALDRINQECR